MKITRRKHTTTIVFDNTKKDQEFAWKYLEILDPNFDESDFEWPEFGEASAGVQRAACT